LPRAAGGPRNDVGWESRVRIRPRREAKPRTMGAGAIRGWLPMGRGTPARRGDALIPPRVTGLVAKDGAPAKRRKWGKGWKYRFFEKRMQPGFVNAVYIDRNGECSGSNGRTNKARRRSLRCR